MKSSKLVLCLVFLAVVAIAFLPACKKGMDEALTAVKDKYVEEITGVIDDYAMKAEELAKKAEALPSPAKEEAMAKIDALKAKLEEGKAKLEEIRMAGDTSWEDVKSTVETIVSELPALYEAAMDAVK